MKPPAHVLELRAPPSKSVTHRACLLAALAQGSCRVVRPLAGADCQATLSVLAALGARFSVQPGGDLDFEPAQLRAPTGPLDCGNSGTTLRLMLGQCARLPFPVTLTGDASLRGRPNRPLLEALARLGVATDSQAGRAPISVLGALPEHLHGPEIRLAGGLSSQFASSLLLAMAMVPGHARLHLEPPVASRPYLDLTLAMAAEFGLGIQANEIDDGGLVFEVAGGHGPTPPPAARYEVEGDWSGAAFGLIGAALGRVPLRLTGLRADSSQGDRAILPLLKRFGVDLAFADGAVTVAGAGLRPVQAIDVGPTPDLFPPLCVLAACCPGSTRLHGSPGLRHKESDRIAAMAAGLAACGIRTEQLDDGLVVHGGRPRGTAVASLGDHRVHMAFAMLGLAATGSMTVDDPTCARVSYPEFHDHLAQLSSYAAGGGSP